MVCTQHMTQSATLLLALLQPTTGSTVSGASLAQLRRPRYAGTIGACRHVPRPNEQSFWLSLPCS
jgi:hypothetical protein